MTSLKDTWKQAGTELGHAFRDVGFGFRDIGRAVIKSAAYGINKADEWANSEQDSQQKNKQNP